MTALAAPPANDNRANATQLNGTETSNQVSNVEATAESGDYGKNTVWWKWTAPSHGTVSLDTINSTSTYIQLSIYLIEANGTNRGLIYLSGSGSSLKPACNFPISEGTRFLICIGIDRSSPASYTGNVRLTLNLNTSNSIASTPFAHAATLNHDQFANRISLTGNTVSGIAYTNQATREAGEPATSGHNTTWWTYRPTSKGVLTITSTGTDVDFYDKTIAVYLGNQVGSLRLVTYGNSYNGVVTLNLPVTPETDYQISLGGDGSNDYGAGVVNLSLNTEALGDLQYPHPATMANDNFNGRLLITQKTAGAMFYNATGSIEAGEPSSTGNRSFWWTYRPQANGRLSITTEGSSFYHPRVTVYQGSTLSNLKAVIGQEKYNSAVSFDFPVTANTDYIVCYGAYNVNSYGLGLLSFSLDTEGSISQLNLPLPATTQNDNFSNRITVPGNNNSVIGYNAGAGREALEPTAAGERTLWWSWTAPKTGATVLDFTGTSMTTSVYISVWQGAELSGLNEVSLNNLGNFQIGFQATGGQTYHIATGSTSANYGGPIVMTVKGAGGGGGNTDPKPVIEPVTVPDWYVGQPTTDMQFTAAHATKYQATGLPAGIKLNTKTGELTGRPTKARIVKGEVVPYKVTITASNASGKSEPYTFEWLVEPLPTSVTGSFYGTVQRNVQVNGRTGLTQGLGGSIQAKVSTSGSASGSIKMAGLTLPFKGAMTPQSDGSLQLTVEFKKPRTLTLFLAINNSGVLSGSLQNSESSAQLEGWRTEPNADRTGNYIVALDPGNAVEGRPNGTGFTSIKISSKGLAILKGKLADGTVLTASTGLAVNGKFSWHQILYKNTGSVQGVLTLSSASITGAADWNKAEQAKLTPSYQDGFSLHNLAVSGGLYPKPEKGRPVLNLPSSLTLTIHHDSLSFPITLTDKNTLAVSPDSVGLKITLAAPTGLINGTYILPGVDGGKPLKMTISGSLVPGQGGRGYFLLPESSDKGAAILSGKFVLGGN